METLTLTSEYYRAKLFITEHQFELFHDNLKFIDRHKDSNSSIYSYKNVNQIYTDLHPDITKFSRFYIFCNFKFSFNISIGYIH